MQYLNKELLDGGLTSLQGQKGKPCVSIIVPGARTTSWHNTDKLITKSAFLKAKAQLESQYKPDEYQPILAALGMLLEQVDYHLNDEGLGFFISPDLKLQIRFSIPVREKVFVGDTFLLRDALFQLSYSLPYYLLHLTGAKAQLYLGRTTELTEITDTNFPFLNTDMYEYSRPVRASSYTGNTVSKSFEKDPSIIKEIRNQQFLHQVDQRLHQYHINNYPLLICGELKEVSYFKQTTQYNKVASIFLVGNYQHLNRAQLGEVVWPVVRLDLDEARNLLVEDFKECIGTGLTETGILNIWQALQEKRAYRLLVEKDFSIPGYVDTATNQLYLQQPGVPHTVLPDAIDDIINGTLEQGGEVVFVENGRLGACQHLALFTRY